MKFVIAPDKFKGSLSGQQFCEAVEIGLQRVFPQADIIKIPLADGGDGTLDVVKSFLKAKEVRVKVHDPLFRKRSATYLFSPEHKMAYIEMAEASGHALLTNEELNCMQTTSLGTGELLSDAMAKGAKKIFLGIGGSATNDGGMGMATAIGYAFLDAENNKLIPIGGNLTKVRKILKPKNDPTARIDFSVICDVENPFYGENGAAKIYAKQKGASDTDIVSLDEGLQNFAAVIETEFGIDVQPIKGSGAAGGMGGGALVFLNGKLRKGIDAVKDIANFDQAIQGADWIITGEGNLDSQTLSGKTISGVVDSARREGIPVAAFCGNVGLSSSEIKAIGINYAISVSKGMPNLKTAMANAHTNVSLTAFEFAKSLKNANL
ncbi:MAG: glycerate kinase [Allomuricauda sp.]|nr:MAG: glycerate kinase [Allomuricauda sp.]